MTAPALLAMASALPLSPTEAAAAKRKHDANKNAAAGADSSSPDLARNYGVGGALFYDRWVARDADGRMFDAAFPYVHGARDAARVAAGRPVPVQACWNGLARLRAEPFARGLRFRRAALGECNHGECSLVADDFARLGFGRVIVDPVVSTAYAFLPRLLLTPGAPVPGSAVDPQTGLPLPTRAEAITRVRATTWAEIDGVGGDGKGKGKSQQVPWLRKEREAATARLRGDERSERRATLVDQRNVDCCPKHLEEDAVPFECVPYDVMKVNFTAAWLEQCGGLGVGAWFSAAEAGGGPGAAGASGAAPRRRTYAVGVLGWEPYAAPTHGAKGERHASQEPCPEW